MSSRQVEREKIVRMLTERGIDGAAGLLDAFDDDALDAALGAILWWDDQPRSGGFSVSTGLLVSKLRHGGMPGYKRPHERTRPEGEMAVTTDLFRRIRGIALSPDGMRRTELRAAYEGAAKRLNTPVDALIDQAVDPVWNETPPHPASLNPDSTWRFPLENPMGMLRYAWVVSNGWTRPDPSISRRSGESDWDFAFRFWGWSDPPELVEALERLQREAARAEAEARSKARENERGSKRPAEDTGGDIPAPEIAETRAATAVVERPDEDTRTDAQREQDARLDAAFGADHPFDDTEPEPDPDDPW